MNHQRQDINLIMTMSTSLSEVFQSKYAISAIKLKGMAIRYNYLTLF